MKFLVYKFKKFNNTPADKHSFNISIFNIIFICDKIIPELFELISFLPSLVIIPLGGFCSYVP